MLKNGSEGTFFKTTIKKKLSCVALSSPDTCTHITNSLLADCSPHGALTPSTHVLKVPPGSIAPPPKSGAVLDIVGLTPALSLPSGFLHRAHDSLPDQLLASLRLSTDSTGVLSEFCSLITVQPVQDAGPLSSCLLSSVPWGLWRSFCQVPCMGAAGFMGLPSAAGLLFLIHAARFPLTVSIFPVPTCV